MSNVFSASGNDKIKDLRLKETLETRLSMNLLAPEVNLVVERAWASVKGAGFEIWRSRFFSASGHNKIKDLRLKETLETRLPMNLLAPEVNLVVERAWASVKGAGFEIWRSLVQIFHPTAM